MIEIYLDYQISLPLSYPSSSFVVFSLNLFPLSFSPFTSVHSESVSVFWVGDRQVPFFLISVSVVSVVTSSSHILFESSTQLDFGNFYSSSFFSSSVLSSGS